MTRNGGSVEVEISHYAGLGLELENVVVDDNTSTTEEIMDEDDYEGEEEELASAAAEVSSILQGNDNDEEDDVIAESDDDEVDLSWRLDPTESLSDWTILVKTKQKPDLVDTFHVHKSVLGVGPRRSVFFQNAFHHVDQLNDQKRFLQQQHSKLQRKAKAGGVNHPNAKQMQMIQQRPKTPAGDIMYLSEFWEESCEFMLQGAAPFLEGTSNLLDIIGAEHRFKHGDQQATCLELDEPAAKAFPALLDYVYGNHNSSNGRRSRMNSKTTSSSSSSGSQLQIDTASAVALHALGEKLEIKPLRKAARTFWKGDLCLDNLLVYYQQARLFNDTLVAKYSAGCLAVSILELEEDQVVTFLQAVDSEFMQQVLQFLVDQHSQQIQKLSLLDAISSNIASSKRLSLLVAIYCNLHRKTLTLETLQRLTAATHMPDLDVKAGQVLLSLENDISGDYATLTSLKRRCIAVLSEQWDHLQLEDTSSAQYQYALQHNVPASMATALQNSTKATNASSSACSVTIPRLEGAALAHFVVRSLTRAKQQLDGMEAIRREWQDLKSQVSALTNQVEQLMLTAKRDEAIERELLDEVLKQQEDFAPAGTTMADLTTTAPLPSIVENKVSIFERKEAPSSPVDKNIYFF